jgi:sulfopyruvate decarboxylase subunit beta
VPAEQVLASLEAVGTTHIVTVPDTNQASLLRLVDERQAPRLVRAASEDDVLGICAGLWISGGRPVAAIQQLGIFASVNALRGLTHDLSIPLAIVAGLYGRELDRSPEASAKSAVRLCVPVLEALELDWALVETPDQAGLIERALKLTFAQERTTVVLLGAPTT